MIEVILKIVHDDNRYRACFLEAGITENFKESVKEFSEKALFPNMSILIDIYNILIDICDFILGRCGKNNAEFCIMN